MGRAQSSPVPLPVKAQQWGSSREWIVVDAEGFTIADTISEDQARHIAALLNYGPGLIAIAHAILHEDNDEVPELDPHTEALLMDALAPFEAK